MSAAGSCASAARRPEIGRLPPGADRYPAGGALRPVAGARRAAGHRPQAGPGARRARARDIDRTGEYPQDLFDLFVDAGLTGLCVPEELGGSGAGILGLTLAIEEVAKYSQAAALMLLLTRLPTGPVLIAGSPEQQRRYVTPVATGAARAAFGL